MIALLLLYCVLGAACFANSLVERSERQKEKLRPTQILIIGALSLAWPIVVPALAFAVTKKSGVDSSVRSDHPVRDAKVVLS